MFWKKDTCRKKVLILISEEALAIILYLEKVERKRKREDIEKLQ